jgi:hypothetical protein
VGAKRTVAAAEIPRRDSSCGGCADD